MSEGNPTNGPPNAARPRWSVVLRALREARGVTLDGWAARIGVSRATVQRWERGARSPDPGAEEAIVAYCREMGLFRSYESGPLAGLTLTGELLQDLIAASRWRTGEEPTAGHVLPDTPRAAPPLPAPTLPPSNLPAALTSFIGRESELAQVRRVQGGTRLLTLTGAGGCGKTRLALMLAGELRWAYPDGVWFVDLAPLPALDVADAGQTAEHEALLAGVLASTLAIRPAGARTLAPALIDALQPRHLLLVIDNCEHLLAPCASLVETLLRTCPHLEVVLTSREPLGIGGETIWRVPPMALPGELTDGAGAPAPAPVPASEAADAVRLFVERARLRRPDFVLTAGELPVVIEICRQLDGIPLAIELAAARAGALSAGQIAARLHDRFHLLTSGSRTALPRHQTLRATMDWSYDLLTPSEQVLLQWLSVFAGGFTLEAVEYLVDTAGSGGNISVLDLLTRLVEKSLVIAEVTGGSPRYRMLETVRQYAAEKLAGAEQADAARAAHLAWCIMLVEAAEAAYRGPREPLWLARLEQEHDNLRTALSRSLEQGESDLALRLAAVLPRFWELYGHLHEGRGWLERALAQAVAAPDESRARALRGLGFLAEMQGHYTAARQVHQQRLELERDRENEQGIAEAQGDLGRTASRLGEYALARELLDAALAGHRRDHNRAGIASVQGSLGMVALHQGDYARARECIEERLAVNRAMGNKDGLADALGDLAMVAGAEGDSERQAVLLEESMNLWRELNSKNGVALALCGLASAARARGEHERAATLAQEALALYRELGDTRGIARATEQLGLIALLQRDAAGAEAWTSESLAHFQAVGDRWAQGRCLIVLAGAAFGLGTPVRAARLFGAAAALSGRLGVTLSPALRPAYERTLAALRRTLGEQDFATAWEKGQALTLDQAVEEALSGAAQP